MAAPLAPNRIHSLPGKSNCFFPFTFPLSRLSNAYAWKHGHLTNVTASPIIAVRVTYHLPTSSQTFSTLFSTPQQVYVHPNAGASSHDGYGDEEAWGSIYLKTVVMGVLMASPEIHPAHPSTTDLSLYVLDPRETYLRKSRAGSSPVFQHLRHHSHTHPHAHAHASGSASSPILSSDASSPSYPPPQPLQEVWTGKGLVSWALDEPGQGKNLITGRLVRSSLFTGVVNENDTGMSALEALMAADAMGSHEESWGIEISIGLKSSVAGHVGVHPQVQTVMAMDGQRRSSVTSALDDARQAQASRSLPASEASYFQRPQHPSVPKGREPSRAGRPRVPPLPHQSSSSSTQLRRVSPAKSTTSNSGTVPKRGPGRPPGAKRGRPPLASSSKKHVPPAHSHSSTRPQLSSLDSNADLQRPPVIPLPKRATAPPSSDAPEPFPTDLPGGLFARPESLTREQAQRLMASPAFLSMLTQLTGAPIDVVAAAKRAREGEEQEERPQTKKLKPSHSRNGSIEIGTPASETHTHNGFVCWNCGRTKSAVWRTKVMEDGKSVRVCNACGLYWNKMGSMRPPTLWGDVDDDPKDRPRKEKKGARSSTGAGSSTGAMAVPSSEPDIPAVRIDKPKTTTSGQGSDGFKRTLSSVVEQDAKRLANLRKPPLPRSTLLSSSTATGNNGSGSSGSVSKPIAMTSPPRGSTSATNSTRNPQAQGQAASSPGWAGNNSQSRPQPTPMQRSSTCTRPTLNTVEESPNTAIRRIFTAPSSEANIQTLDMPLSDDNTPNPDSTSKSDALAPAPTQGTGAVDWSAFFDVDGFSMPPLNTSAPHSRAISPAPPFSHQYAPQHQQHQQHRTLTRNSTSTSLTDAGTEEDDVLSQLFNRTSSVGLESSPMPFDFSQLPPSSPPLSVGMSQDLPHSALLLSSPDESPAYSSTTSPFDRKATPEKSKLRHQLAAASGTAGAGASAASYPLANEKNNHNNNSHPLSNSLMAPPTQPTESDFNADEFHKLLSSLNTTTATNITNSTSNLANLHLNTGEGMSYEMLQEIFRMSQPQQPHLQSDLVAGAVGNGDSTTGPGPASSSAEAESMVGGDLFQSFMSTKY